MNDGCHQEYRDQNADPFMLAAFDVLMRVSEQQFLFSESDIPDDDMHGIALHMRALVRPFVCELLEHMKSSFRPLTLASVLQAREKMLAKNDNLCEVLREHGQEQQADEMERQAEMVRGLPREITEFDRTNYIDELVARMYKMGCEPAQRTATYQTTAAALRALGSDFSARLPDLSVEDLESLEEVDSFLTDACLTAIRHLRQCWQKLVERARKNKPLDAKTLEFLQKEFLLPPEHLNQLHALALRMP